MIDKKPTINQVIDLSTYFVILKFKSGNAFSIAPLRGDPVGTLNISVEEEHSGLEGKFIKHTFNLH